MIYVLFGVSGSGKTSLGKAFANHLGCRFFDADDFHPLSNIQKMKSGIALDDTDRYPWLIELGEKIVSPYKNSTAILACSALKRQYRELLASYGSLRFYLIEGSFDLISSRLEQRDGHFMPSALLQSQFESLESFPNDGIVTAHLSIQEQIMQLEKLL
jgi:carbohydrate kinase (thermoresistant glucokinase family)